MNRKYTGGNYRIPVLAFVAMFGLWVAPAANAQTTDLWQSTNEGVFKFNDYFDQLLVRPAALTYTLFVPRVARQGIGNFFSNLDDINVFANDMLQLKLDAALSDSGRFLINSTIGMAGVFDFASGFGLTKNEEDFGQTLGRWGVASGPYVMLPVFGASNLRDSFGLVLDTLFNPLQYHEREDLKFSMFLLRETDSRSGLLALDDLISGDRYLFVREAYMQRRDFLVNDGRVEDEFGGF
ncbi:MAG: VacJ family lipoprotein [Gammaproteobacteria bacterium]|nr:VacJ family lipoprotein [Gammaproteobacteria bacterium]